MSQKAVTDNFLKAVYDTAGWWEVSDEVRFTAIPTALLGITLGLNGKIDDQGITTGDRARINYPYLEPGNYYFLLRPNDLPTETSLVTVSPTGTHAYKKLSELVDTTSTQAITGTKNFESTGKNYCITCQTIINDVTYTAKLSGGELLFTDGVGSGKVQANYSINGVYSRHLTSSSSGLLKLPIDMEGTFAITPNAAPTEPSVVVNATDRTPSWKPVSELGGNALKVTVW